GGGGGGGRGGAGGGGARRAGGAAGDCRGGPQTGGEALRRLRAGGAGVRRPGRAETPLPVVRQRADARRLACGRVGLVLAGSGAAPGSAGQPAYFRFLSKISFRAGTSFSRSL